MMSRKNYEAIASVIKEAVRRTDDGDMDKLMPLYQLAHSLTVVLKEDNPRFDRAKFLEACDIR